MRTQEASHRFRVAQRTGPNSTYYDIVRFGTHDWALTDLFLGRTTFSCAPKRPRAMRMRGVPYKAHHPLSVWSMWDLTAFSPDPSAMHGSHIETCPKLGCDLGMKAIGPTPKMKIPRLACCLA
ncbi:hypothetical protein L3X38_043107 [Prunus dulcis]|uniref:Uncharacterized protein n=1 Tax=Prunus dulcis TaxID=3755 RepID=A0AAD4UXH9_PRUDU|nr:hypothetical protein L3X38_043107 [Prunus dulcis]